MPNMVVFGRNWDQCSDMLPLSMICPIIAYTGALIPLAIQTYLPRDPDCYRFPGHGWYRVTINTIFGIFGAQLALELSTFFAGLIGTPLQTRKRWLAEYLLFSTYLNNIIQIGATIVGSWTLAHYPHVPCPEDHALKPLVIVSWVYLGLSLLYFLLSLQWIPQHKSGIERWVRRLRFLCSLCSCLGFATALEPLRKLDLEEEEANEGGQRERALVEHLAETFHIIFGNLDFTASDRHVGLVLATALQQKRRHSHIKECLLEGKDAQSKDKEVKEVVKPDQVTQHCLVQQHPTVICPSGYAQKIKPEMSPQEAADRYTGFSDRVALGDLEEALGYFEYAVAAYYVEDKGTVATEEGKEKGKEQAEQTGSETVASPGALHDKPMGDDPPPVDEGLPNQPAPTFYEYRDPHSSAMDAISGSDAASLRDNVDSERLQSIAEHGPETPEGESSEEVRGDNAAAAGTQSTVEPSESSSVSKTPPWTEGVSRSADRAGEDPMRPTAGRSRLEQDDAGNPVVRIDIKDKSGPHEREGVVGRTVNQIHEKAHDLKHKLGNLLPTKGDQTGSAGGDGSSTLGRGGKIQVEEKMTGMDKTAAKAMKGELQKGGQRKGQSPAAHPAPSDEKVTSSYCCFCETQVPQATPLDKLDCIYSRAHNTILGTLPYMIALDWERKTVVLGVRGTSSMSDALTDAIAQPIPILPWLGTMITEDDGSIASVHSGILASAAALNYDLEDHGILNALFTGAAVDQEAKEKHTEEQPSQLDDKLVAMLAETPAAAVFADAHAIESIPVTDILSSSVDRLDSDILRAESSLPMPQRISTEQSGPNNAGNPQQAFSPSGDSYLSTSLMSESPDLAGSFNGRSHRDMPGLKSNRVVNTQFANGSDAALSPFARSSTSPFSNEVEGSDRSAANTIAAMRAQSQFTSKELKARDEEVIQSALNAKRMEQKKNQDAHDLAKLSRWSPTRRGSIELTQANSPVHSPAKRAQSAHLRNSFWGALRAGSSSKALSQSLPEQSQGVTGLVNGAPLDMSHSVGQNRQPAGNFLAQEVEPSHSSAETVKSGVLHDAGRAMKRFYQDHKGNRDSKKPDRESPTGDQGKPSYLQRVRSKRVRFQNDEASSLGKEERIQLQKEAKLKKLQEARHRKLKETMKKAEAQIQKTFMAKIFKSQQDLRNLDKLAASADEAKKRAEFRLQQLKQLEERKLDCRGWQLVLTGHSLGAGVAALLALKLRPRFPDLQIKCWAFCPPGGLVTAGLAAAMEPFCTSVIVGKDAVPRASLGNLSRLVDEVVVALARGRCCKATILLRNLTSRGRAKCRRTREYFPIDKIPEECQQVLDQYGKGLEKRMEAIGQSTFPPGRVIYCRRLKESATESSFDSVWVSPQDVMKEGFIISSRMLKDHLCDSVTAALELSIEKLKEDQDKDKFRRQANRHEEPLDSSDEESDGE